MNVKQEPLSDNEDSEEIKAMRRTKRPKKRIDWGFLKYPRKKRKDPDEGTEKEGILIDTREEIIASKHEDEQETLPPARYLHEKGSHNNNVNHGSGRSHFTFDGCYGVTRMDKVARTAPSSEATLSADSDIEYTDQECHGVFTDHSYAVSPPKKKRKRPEPKKETVETDKARWPTVDIATLAAYRSLIDHTYSSITPSSIIDAVMLKHNYICTIQNIEFQEEGRIKAGYIQDHSRHEAENAPEWDTSQPVLEQSAKPSKKKGGKPKAVEPPPEWCDLLENTPPECEPAGCLAENPKFRRKNKSPKRPSRIKVEKREISPVSPKVPAKKLNKSPTKKKTNTKKEKPVKKEEVYEKFDSSSLSSKPEAEEETKKLKRRRRRNQTGWPTKYKSQPNKSKNKSVAKNPKYRLPKTVESSPVECSKKDIKIEKDDEINSFEESYESIEEAVKRRRQSQKETKKENVVAKKGREKRKVKSVYQNSGDESSQLNEHEEGSPKRVGRKKNATLKSSLANCIKQEPQSSDDEVAETDDHSDNVSTSGSLSRRSRRKISIPARFREAENQKKSSTKPTTSKTKETKNKEVGFPEKALPLSDHDGNSAVEDSKCRESATDPVRPLSMSPPPETRQEKGKDDGGEVQNTNDTIPPHIPVSDSLEKAHSNEGVSSQVENTSDSPSALPKSPESTQLKTKDDASTLYQNSSASRSPILPSKDLKNETERVDDSAAASGDLVNQEDTTGNLVPNPKVRMSLRKRVKLQVTSLFKSRKTSKSKTSQSQPTKLVKVKEEIFDEERGHSGSSSNVPTDSRDDSTLQSPTVSTKSKRRRKKLFWGHHRKPRSKEDPKVKLSPVKSESKKKGDRNFPDHKKDEIVENPPEVDEELRRAELGLAIIKVETMESDFILEESCEQEGNQVVDRSNQDSERSEILKDSKENCADSQETDPELTNLTCTEKFDQDGSRVSGDLVDKGGVSEGMMEPEVVYPPLDRLDYTGWTNTKTIYTTDVSSDSELDDDCIISVAGDISSDCNDSRSCIQSPSPSECEAVLDADEGDVHESQATDVSGCRSENSECHPGTTNIERVESDRPKQATLVDLGCKRTSSDLEVEAYPLDDIGCSSSNGSKVAILVESDNLKRSEPTSTFKDIPEGEARSNQGSGRSEILKDSTENCAVSQEIHSELKDLTCTEKFDSLSTAFGCNSTKYPPEEKALILEEPDQSKFVEPNLEKSPLEECLKPSSNPEDNPLPSKVMHVNGCGLGDETSPSGLKVAILEESDPSKLTKPTWDDVSDTTIKPDEVEKPLSSRVEDPDHFKPAKSICDNGSDLTSKPEEEDDPLSSRDEYTVRGCFSDRIISHSTGKEAEDRAAPYQSTAPSSTSGERRSSNYSEQDPLLSKVMRDSVIQFGDSASLPEIESPNLVEPDHPESAKKSSRSFSYRSKRLSSDSRHDRNMTSNPEEEEEEGEGGLNSMKAICSFGCCSNNMISPSTKKGAVCMEPDESKAATVTCNDDRTFYYSHNSSSSNSEEEEQPRVMDDIGTEDGDLVKQKTLMDDKHSSRKPEDSFSSRVVCAMGCCSSNKICPPGKGVLKPSKPSSGAEMSSSSDERVELEDDPTSTTFSPHQAGWEEWIKLRRGKLRKLKLRQRKILQKLRKLRAKRKAVVKKTIAFTGLRAGSTLNRMNRKNKGDKTSESLCEKEPLPKPFSHENEDQSEEKVDDEKESDLFSRYEVEVDPLSFGGTEYDPLCDWDESRRVTDVIKTSAVELEHASHRVESSIDTADINLGSEPLRVIDLTKTARVRQNRPGEIDRFYRRLPSIIRRVPLNKVIVTPNEKENVSRQLLPKPVALEDRMILDRVSGISSKFDPLQSCTVRRHGSLPVDGEPLMANTDLQENMGISEMPKLLPNLTNQEIFRMIGVGGTLPEHLDLSNPPDIVPIETNRPSTEKAKRTVGIRTITARENARRECQQINNEHAYCRKDLGYNYNNHARDDRYNIYLEDDGILEGNKSFVVPDQANIGSEKQITNKFPMIVKPKPATVKVAKTRTPDAVPFSNKPNIPDSYDLSGIATLPPEPASKAVTNACIRSAYKGGVYPAPENSKAGRIQDEGSPYTPPPEIARLDVLVRKRFKMPTGNVSYFLKKDGRPPFSYQTIAAMAIESDPLMSATARDVFEFMMKHFPFYRKITSKWWKHNVRTMLSTSKIFRSDRIGSKTYYSFCKELRLPGDPAIYEMTEDPPTDVSDLSEEEEDHQQETSDQGEAPLEDDAFGQLFCPLVNLEESSEVDPLIPICSYSDDESDGFPVIVNAETYTGGDLPPHSLPEADDQHESDPEIKEEPDEGIFCEEPTLDMEATSYTATGERLYSCQFCPAIFDTLQDNLDHKVTHPEVMKPCPLCEFSSPDDVQLLWHVNAAHSG